MWSGVMNMMRIVTLLCLLFVVGCEPTKDVTGNQPTTKFRIQHGVKEVYHDGCQYIVIAYGNRGGITHKGNCNNPMHPKERGYVR